MKFQLLCKLSTGNFEWFLVCSSHPRTREERNQYESFKISYPLSFGTNLNLNNLYLSNFFGSIVHKNSAKQSCLMNETAGAFYVSSFSVSYVATSTTLSSHILENLTVILDKWWWQFSVFLNWITVPLDSLSPVIPPGLFWNKGGINLRKACKNFNSNWRIVYSTIAIVALSRSLITWKASDIRIIAP